MPERIASEDCQTDLTETYHPKAIAARNFVVKKLKRASSQNVKIMASLAWMHLAKLVKEKKLDRTCNLQEILGL
jgi:hypothetical protein